MHQIWGIYAEASTETGLHDALCRACAPRLVGAPPLPRDSADVVSGNRRLLRRLSQGSSEVGDKHALVRGPRRHRVRRHRVHVHAVSAQAACLRLETARGLCHLSHLHEFKPSCCLLSQHASDAMDGIEAAMPYMCRGRRRLGKVLVRYEGGEFAERAVP